MEKSLMPDIQIVKDIPIGMSVVCILGNNDIPDIINLNEAEKEFVSKRISEKDDFIVLNSYKKFTFIVRAKDGVADFYRKEELRKTASKIKNSLQSYSIDSIVITTCNLEPGSVEAFTEGLILSLYSFDKYKTGEKSRKHSGTPSKILLHNLTDTSLLEWLLTVSDSLYKVRDLINEPVNHLNATTLAKEIKHMGGSSGFSVEVMSKGKIEALKMGGLLAVNKGSIDPPVFCILEWKPENSVNEKPVVLVGKGVVYDTGGLNIKTGDYMNHMKADMAGAAVVAGVFNVIARSLVPVHIIGLIPVTDNRPGGNAYAQGDIITMHNGMTVEVQNTDAEGRLIMADALSYASVYNPELIIDIATLTGSAAMTFGTLATAVMGNADRIYFKMMKEAGNEVFERVAELPFWDEYGVSLESDVADLKNIGGKEAGAISAGKFLEKFTGFPLMHIDIAGPAMLKKNDFYRTKEGPGTGLRLLTEFLRQLVKTKQYDKK